MSSQKWNSKIQFPTDSNFTARICGASFGQSNKDNPMITLDWEVVLPTDVEVAGEMVNIAGVKCKSYYNVTVFDEGEIDKDKTSKVRLRLHNPNKKDGLFDMLDIKPEDINWDNPDVDVLKGKAFFVMMEPKVEEKRKNPTLVELEEARKKGIHPSKAGAIMKHPVTGKPIVDYWPEIKQIFALAPEGSVGTAY